VQDGKQRILMYFSGKERVKTDTFIT